MSDRKSKWEIVGTTHKLNYVEIKGRECYITLEPRPSYCDRGNWIAKISTTGWLAQEFDDQDLWPRYYMDFDRAKLEIEDWMKKRGQWV